MYAKQMLNTVCACMLALTMAAYHAESSWFEAHTTGAKVLTLRGSAEYGSVQENGAGGVGAFVLTLGAHSSLGAVVFTRADGKRLQVGIYKLSEEPASGIQALVVTGSPTRPTGAYRARSGILTITRSRGDLIEGTFDFDAVGFDATDQGDETRMLQVQGSFAASPSAPQGTPGDVTARREALVAR
jgi:hypothetical protein